MLLILSVKVLVRREKKTMVITDGENNEEANESAVDAAEEAAKKILSFTPLVWVPKRAFQFLT